MNQEYEDEELDFLGWCAYCKEPIAEQDRHIKKRKKVYHEDCFEQATDNRKELNFE